MKKLGVKGYGVIGILCWIISLTFFVIASLSEDFDLGNIGKIGFGIVGILVFLLGIRILYKGITAWVESDKEAKIEQHDERNEIIRGKVAQDVNLFSSIIYTVIMFVLMVADQMLGVVLIAVAHIVTNIYQTVRFAKYYNEM